MQRVREKGEGPETSKRERSQTVLDQALKKHFKMEPVREQLLGKCVKPTSQWSEVCRQSRHGLQDANNGVTHKLSGAGSLVETQAQLWPRAGKPLKRSCAGLRNRKGP